MNTMRTKRVVWPLALLATAFFLGCQEQASSPVEPEGPGILLDKAGENHPHGGKKDDDDSGKEFEVVLSEGYSTKVGGTEFPQDINFEENGRRVIVRTDDGAQIEYSLNILDITTNGSDHTLPFVDTCVWSGLADATAAVDFWNEFLDTHSGSRLRNLLFRVNKKAEGEPAGEHRTEARWWVETATERVMYLVKVGVPGKVLRDQLSEKLGTEFEPAIGEFDGSTTVTISGGAVRLSRHNCGDPVFPEATAGCGPQAPTLEVACVNPTSGDFQQVFIATVTPIEA